MHRLALSDERVSAVGTALALPPSCGLPDGSVRASPWVGSSRPISRVASPQLVTAERQGASNQRCQRDRRRLLRAVAAWAEPALALLAIIVALRHVARRWVTAGSEER
jgi:hypothetical protein